MACHTKPPPTPPSPPDVKWCGACGRSLGDKRGGAGPSSAPPVVPSVSCRLCGVSVHTTCLCVSGERTGGERAQEVKVKEEVSMSSTRQWVCDKCVFSDIACDDKLPWYKRHTQLPQCVFCSMIHPHIYTTRMQSGFWAHSCCVSTGNVELTHADCSLCSKKRGAVVCYLSLCYSYSL